jgi:ribokinase
MNFWIERKRDRLLEVLRRVDVILLNEAEARQLCSTPSLAVAGRMLMEMGPRTAIIKKGEHGVVMYAHGCHFAAPSYPLEEVRDPTGAGDSFAGGFVGYLAHTDDPTDENLRKAVVCGSAMASFCVQDFSLRRLESLTPQEIMERCSEFRRISSFEEICDLPEAKTPTGRADHV